MGTLGRGFCSLVLLSLVANSRGRGLAEPAALTPSIQGHENIEANLVKTISEAQKDTKKWTLKAGQVVTLEKAQNVKREAQKAVDKASEAMKELARLSANGSIQDPQLFDEGRFRYDKVFVNRIGAVMVSYSTLIKAYGKDIEQDKRQLDDLHNTIDGPTAYPDAIKSAVAKLGIQVVSALEFVTTMQQLVTEEPDLYWRGGMETEQETKNRSQNVLAEGVRVVQLVYSDTNQQMNTLLNGMVEIWILLHQMVSKRPDDQGEPDAAKETELQAVDNEVSLLAATRDALWELTPVAPMKEVQDKISRGDTVDSWGWLGVVTELGWGVFSGLAGITVSVTGSGLGAPAGSASGLGVSAAEVLKAGRTGSKVAELTRKIRRVIEKQNKICGKLDTLTGIEQLATDIEAIMNRITMGLKDSNRPQGVPGAGGASDQGEHDGGTYKQGAKANGFREQGATAGGSPEQGSKINSSVTGKPL
ncbi:hypothetical protein HRG_001665 [Hirsutella rhossiliensis]|uniref:Uncharacterized protein n=1 Tax=Hirsutella rhossiliensis TaxID=111463 RepID=A0A9P8SKU4_9HYPO|nr:uncharacterized protein HRG_01665 [Hirsutella rhossiliensis]KAH0966256.1 hypothetical protein HRG_01665 [Hirsutella rhossiliensis]